MKIGPGFRDCLFCFEYFSKILFLGLVCQIPFLLNNKKFR